MKVIGITGPSGAGKSICSDYCRQLGFPVMDADATYHAVIVPPSPCLDELQKTFGSDVINADGTLNRVKLADVVFSDQTHTLQHKLNDVTHHYVLDAIRGEIQKQKQNGAKAVFVDAPLLIESGFHKECDAVISVLADSTARLTRIMQRDGIEQQTAQKRIDAQPNDDFYVCASQYVVYNNASAAEVIAKLQTVFHELGIVS